MDLTPYLESLRDDLAGAAAPGGPDVERAAELLTGSLEASVRLTLMEALADAAAEITTRLTSASVEVRLRGRDADLVVTEVAPEPEAAPVAPVVAVEGGDLTRLTLRIPESLKELVERLANDEGVSVNQWLTRAVAAAAGNRPAAGPPTRIKSEKRITGFAQA
jgi:hypothetical protein